MRELANNKYRNLYEEDKNKKKEYGKNRYHNMSEEKKQKLKEYKKNIGRLKRLNRIINIYAVLDTLTEINLNYRPVVWHSQWHHQLPSFLIGIPGTCFNLTPYIVVKMLGRVCTQRVRGIKVYQLAYICSILQVKLGDNPSHFKILFL